MCQSLGEQFSVGPVRHQVAGRFHCVPSTMNVDLFSPPLLFLFLGSSDNITAMVERPLHHPSVRLLGEFVTQQRKCSWQESEGNTVYVAYQSQI